MEPGQHTQKSYAFHRQCAQSMSWVLTGPRFSSNRYQSTIQLRLSDSPFHLRNPTFNVVRAASIIVSGDGAQWCLSLNISRCYAGLTVLQSPGQNFGTAYWGSEIADTAHRDASPSYARLCPITGTIISSIRGQTPFLPQVCCHLSNAIRKVARVLMLFVGGDERGDKGALWRCHECLKSGRLPVRFGARVCRCSCRVPGQLAG